MRWEGWDLGECLCQGREREVEDALVGWYNLFVQEAILFERMKEEGCKLGTHTKWIRSRQAVEKHLV